MSVKQAVFFKHKSLSQLLQRKQGGGPLCYDVPSLEEAVELAREDQYGDILDTYVPVFMPEEPVLPIRQKR